MNDHASKQGGQEDTGCRKSDTVYLLMGDAAVNPQTAWRSV